MRRLAAAALLAIAILASGCPALAQAPGGGGGAPIAATSSSAAMTPLAGAVMGSMAVAAVAPMGATVVLGRELTLSEVWHLELGIFLGPPGWWLADQMFAPGRGGPAARPPSHGHGRGSNIDVPPAGAADFVPNEVLVEFRAGASARQIALVISRLQLTQLEAQTFALINRTLGAALRALQTLSPTIFSKARKLSRPRKRRLSPRNMSFPNCICSKLIA